MTGRVIATVLCAAIAFGAHASTAREWAEHAYTAFSDTIDIYSALEAHGELLFAGQAEEHLAIVLWDAAMAQPTIILDGAIVDDLMAWEEENVIYFDGLLDDEQRPTFFGSLAVNTDGHVVLDLERVDFEGVRITIGSGPDFLRMSTCVCWGRGAKRGCTNQQCTDLVCCSTGPGACSAYCQWRATDAGL